MNSNNLRTEIEKILYSVHPKHKSGNCLRFKGATAQLEALIQEYVEGIVPPEPDYVTWVEPHTSTDKPDGVVFGLAKHIEMNGYQKCRADILSKLGETK